MRFPWFKRHDKSHVESFDTLVMKHCLTVVEARKVSGNVDAWLWEAKERVARYILKKYQDEVNSGRTPAEARGELTEDEKQEVERAHPLLQCARPQPRTQLSPEWTKQIKVKIENYVSTLKKQYAEQSPGVYSSKAADGPTGNAQE